MTGSTTAPRARPPQSTDSRRRSTAGQQPASTHHASPQADAAAQGRGTWRAGRESGRFLPGRRVSVGALTEQLMRGAASPPEGRARLTSAQPRRRVLT